MKSNMKKETKIKVVVVLMFLVCLVLVGCGEPDAAEVAAKYEDEVARAIVEGSWKLAGAILLGLIIGGALAG